MCKISGVPVQGPGQSGPLLHFISFNNRGEGEVAVFSAVV